MNQLNRREFFVRGGAALSLGALVAACGGGELIGPGRVGTGDSGPTLPPVEVDDSVLLRTAQSLHHTAADVQQRVLDSGALAANFAAALTTVVKMHADQAKVLGAASGSSFDCPNPFIEDRYVGPAFAAFADSDDPERDATNMAMAFEEWVVRSHQGLTSALASANNRSLMLEVGNQTARQSVALQVTAGVTELNPVLTGGDPVDKDEDGFPMYYVIPSVFAQLTAVPLAVGPLNADGQRFSVNLQTPADNTYVLPSMTCG